VFDNNGVFIRKWGSAGSGDGEFQHPTGIAVDQEGNVYVADYENQRVQKLDASGSFVQAWSTESGGTPEGIAIDADGHIYVTDYDRGRVEVRGQRR